MYVTAELSGVYLTEPLAGILREMNITRARAAVRDRNKPGDNPPLSSQLSPTLSANFSTHFSPNFTPPLSPPLTPQLSPLAPQLSPLASQLPPLLGLWAWSDIIRCPPAIYLHDPWACNFVPFTNCSHREKVTPLCPLSQCIAHPIH